MASFRDESVDSFSGARRAATSAAGRGRELVTTLMRRIGIETIDRRANTSTAGAGHTIHPYRLLLPAAAA